jgi:hypothetical protein
MAGYLGRGIDQIDNISTLDNLSFNGSLQTFNLTQNSVAFVPVSADALQIQIDGVIQSGNYTVSGSTVTFDFTPSGSSVCNGIRHYGVGIITQPSDGSVNMAQLGASGTKDATTFLRGDNTFSTVTSTTINNNADNRVITGSGTANTLEGEANLTFDGSTLTVKPSSNVHQLKLEQNNATDYWSLHADSGGGPLSFQRFTGGAETEKVRFQSNGDVFFGCTGTPSASVKGIAIEQDNELLISTNSTSADTIVRFFNNNGQVGKIETSGSSTSYDTSSDYRLKENINYDFDATTRVKQLKPARFNFIADADTTLDGFIAHEVTPIIPEAISGEKDAVDSEGNIDPQGIDQSKLVPLLTKALQEAITKIETLEARVQTLENA